MEGEKQKKNDIGEDEILDIIGAREEPPLQETIIQTSHTDEMIATRDTQKYDFFCDIAWEKKAAKSLRLGIWAIVLSLTCVGAPIGFMLSLIAFSLGCVAITGMRLSCNSIGKSKAIAGITIGLGFYVLLVIADPLNSVFYGAEFHAWKLLIALLFPPYLTSAIWTGLDSSILMRNITKEEINQIGGGIAQSPSQWILACTFLGYIGWLLYIAKRQDYIDFQIQKHTRQARLKIAKTGVGEESELKNQY